MTAPDGTGSEQRTSERATGVKREAGGPGVGEERDRGRDREMRPAG